jgi:hypothetical protein
VSRGSSLAREAMAEPREGTILSVIQAFAMSLREQADCGRDFRTGFRNALTVAREALRHTPDQLAALRAAGVVDAGALGFVDLLEGIEDFIETGRGADDSDLPEELAAAGVDTARGGEYTEGHRYCTECVISGEAVDRGALKAALLAMPISSLVIAGTREKVRIHAHLDEPTLLFETAARFGAVSREKADDMRAQSKSAHTRREQVAIVADSGADIPAEAMDRLNIHLVPVRLSIGGRDFLDRVSISPREFYNELRTSPVPPRTSQPPQGDFRRLFEFLLSHHERVIDVSLARGLSGTLQSAESAASRTDPSRVAVFDSCNGSAGQGLLTIWAAEAALAGWSSERIVEGLARMRPRSTLYAVVRDIRYGIRGGRAPKLAGPLTRLLRFSPVVKSKVDGRLGLAGAVWGREELPEKFARNIAKRLDPSRQWRLVIGHCDCAEDAERVHATLLRSVRNIDRAWVMEAGVAIGAHAGPGSLVIGVQAYEPPQP